MFEQHGADAWYERPIEEFLPDGLTCPSCGGTSFEREQDILDVWFDSGSSHEAVLPRWEGLRWPSDMYLEGSDQHRGWFQSSLLVALATRGRPPYREVLTHGFLIDLEGRKMSKSVGNVDRPAGRHQGERRRDHPPVGGDDRVHRGAARQQGDPDARGGHLPQAAQHLPHPGRQPLRLRSGRRHACRSTSLDAVDRFALARYADADARIRRAYAEYDFSTVSQTLNTLVTVDLSAFYVDVTKDRMYTLGAALARRGARRRPRCTSSATGWRACWRRFCR